MSFRSCLPFKALFRQLLSLSEQQAHLFETPVLTGHRADGYTSVKGLPVRSVWWDETADYGMVVTDHSGVDYATVAERASLVVDARGELRAGVTGGNVVELSLQPTV